MWGKTSNDVNSLKSLKWIPGINIIEEPQTLKILDKSFLLIAFGERIMRRKVNS